MKMAKLRATIKAYQGEFGGNLSETSRLSNNNIVIEVSTFHTSVKVSMMPNGHGTITIYRNGQMEKEYFFEPES